MKPGQVPATREQAREAVREYRMRVDLALGQYLERAVVAQVELDETVREQHDQTLAELAEGADMEKSMHMAALTELLADLFLYCQEHDLDFTTAYRMSVAVQQELRNGLTRLLVFGAPDGDPEADGGDVWLAR